MTRGPDPWVRPDEITAAIEDPYLVLFEYEVVRRLAGLLGHDAVRCRVGFDGPVLRVELIGPPVSAPTRRGVSVRVHDGVRAMGRTVGDLDVVYTARPIAAVVRKEHPMQADVGDRIIIKGHHLGEPSHDGEIVEVRGADGHPPYRVRWEDTGRVTLFFPGPDAELQHFEHPDQLTTT